jgi:hypothetical protein
MRPNYTFNNGTLQLDFKATTGTVATCILLAYGHKVEIQMSSDDFTTLQAAGFFDEEGKSDVFNNVLMTGEL